MTQTCFVTLLALSLVHAALAQGRERGVINDPDGFTNVRAEQGADSAVVAKVKTGEVFEFESGEGSEWWEVTLTPGNSGWMHSSRIRFHHSLDEIPEKDEEGSEVGYYGQAHGFDYCATARAAAKGEPAAMKRYFGINDTDGGAAEGHAAYFRTVIHLLGDEKLAAFLKDHPLEYQSDVRNAMGGDFVLYPFESGGYLERNFPQTAKLLCRKQITHWGSPDGRHAIRKTFSHAWASENSRVTKAELIEKATGKSIADLTEDDIGVGMHREGKVLWSPDSNRFAYFSGTKGGGGGAQTIVYQKKDEKFARVDLPKVEFPGRANDEELKGARHLWAFVEPQRWERPDVLVLLHHDYFEGKRPDRSIRSIGRTYDVTHNFTTGKATARVKRHDE